jgi:hypothetical protein
MAWTNDPIYVSGILCGLVLLAFWLSKFKGWKEMINVGGEKKEGYLGLQYHGDNIWFRNLKVREL